jgi:hypothetical protein
VLAPPPGSASFTCSTTRLITLRARLAALGAFRTAAAPAAPAAAPAAALTAAAARTVFLVGRLRAAFRAASLRRRAAALLFDEELARRALLFAALRFAALFAPPRDDFDAPRRAEAALLRRALDAPPPLRADFEAFDAFDDLEEDALRAEDFFDEDFAADFLLLLLPADFFAPPFEAPPFFEPPLPAVFFFAAMNESPYSTEVSGEPYFAIRGVCAANRQHGLRVARDEM